MKTKIMLLAVVLISFCLIQGCYNECSKMDEKAVIISKSPNYEEGYILMKSCDGNYYIVDVRDKSATKVNGLPDCHKKAEAVKKNK